MQDKKTLVVNYLTTISEIYSKNISQATIMIYWRILKDYNVDELQRAFSNIISISKFFPKPAEIIEQITGNKEDRALSAWMKVHNAVRQHGYYSSIDFEDPIIVKTIEQIGGWQKICSQQSDEFIWTQKEFERIYKNLIVSNYNGKSTIVMGYLEQHNRLNGFLEDIPKPVKINNHNKIKNTKRAVIEG